MELLDGGQMREHMMYHKKMLKKLSEDQCKFIIACIVQALETVHSSGIVHTDINPSNLHFDNQGYLKLTNFGQAK